MRIKLRPYHPTFVVGYIGMDGKVDGYNKDGFNDVIDKIRKNIDIEIEFVHEFDDICKKCDRRVEDESGSVWGKKHTCSSAQDENTVKEVNKVNELVFQKLGLKFGSVVKMKDLVKLLAAKIPVMEDIKQGKKFQKDYKKGLSLLNDLYTNS